MTISGIRVSGRGNGPDERGSRQQEALRQRGARGTSSYRSPTEERVSRQQEAVNRVQTQTGRPDYSTVVVSGRDRNSRRWGSSSWSTSVYTSGSSTTTIKRRTELGGSGGACFKLMGLVTMVAFAILFIPALFY